MRSGRAVAQPFHAFRVKPIDPFGHDLGRYVELARGRSMAQAAFGYIARMTPQARVRVSEVNGKGRPMKTIFDLCVPRADVAEGRIRDEEFAADLANVISPDGKGEHKEYTYPVQFL